MNNFRGENFFCVITTAMAILTGWDSCLRGHYVIVRSPWSNTYHPRLDDGFLPSEKLRAMEVEANELFDAYRELYFEGGTSSVYLWDLDNGFAGCYLIKKCNFIALTTIIYWQLWRAIVSLTVDTGTPYTWSKLMRHLLQKRHISSLQPSC